MDPRYKAVASWGDARKQLETLGLGLTDWDTLKVPRSVYGRVVRLTSMKLRPPKRATARSKPAPAPETSENLGGGKSLQRTKTFAKWLENDPKYKAVASWSDAIGKLEELGLGLSDWDTLKVPHDVYMHVILRVSMVPRGMKERKNVVRLPPQMDTAKPSTLPRPRRLSVKSLDAIVTLNKAATDLTDLKQELSTCQRLVAQDKVRGLPALRKMKTRVGMLIGAAAKLQRQKIDSVICGPLTSGKDNARQQRKALNKQTIRLIEECEHLHECVLGVIDHEELETTS